KRRAIECRAETFRALMRAEKMKTLVGIFSQHQARKQTGRLFRLWNFLRVRLFRVAVFLEAFDFADRLEIHLSIRAIQIRKFSGQSFAKKITRDFARLVDL